MHAELEAVLTKIRDADLPSFPNVDHALVRSTTFGESLLHVVAIWGDVESAKVLLDAGVEIDLPGEDGFTALHEAVLQGHADMVRLLLSRGADPTKKGNWGGDAFLHAKVRGETEIEAILREPRSRDV